MGVGCTVKATPRSRYLAAWRARELHSELCPQWDMYFDGEPYEGCCWDCVEHREKVRAARKALRKHEKQTSNLSL